jgi:acetoin utilization deacetylase AcuC-like enzyme
MPRPDTVRGVPLPVLFHHPASLAHDTGAHPEQAQRIVAIESALAARDWLGYERQTSPEATIAQLETIHPARHLDLIRRVCEEGGGHLDPDTVVSPGSWEAALHSAGGAVALVDALVGGTAPTGASLHRPPGHHAEPDRAMGFCLLANVGVAARHAIDAHGLERILVLDWDVHHGNGTQAIFYDDPRVLFCSIHQWPMWPGSGRPDEIGTGAGAGYTRNFPVPAGSGDALWCSLVEHVVTRLARTYRPQLVLISAGYDAHRDDPLAGCMVTDDGFATMAASVGAVAAQLGAPVGVVLEGGYDLAALAQGVTRTLDVLSAPPAAPDVEHHPFAERAGAGVVLPD